MRQTVDARFVGVFYFYFGGEPSSERLTRTDVDGVCPSGAACITGALQLGWPVFQEDAVMTSASPSPPPPRRID
ncbi:hypothetical protein MRX96_039464 [Rhipicephalus microplus]